MKTLIVLLGPNGVGKSTAAQALVHRTSNSAWVDANWCRAMNPFEFTNTSKEAVAENMHCLIRNYLKCADIQTVVFPCSLHGQWRDIYEGVLVRLRSDSLEPRICTILLTCSKEENIRRCEADGRDSARIQRGLEDTFSLYNAMDLPRIDTTELTPEETVAQILDLVQQAPLPEPSKSKRKIPKAGILAIAALLLLRLGLGLYISGKTDAPTVTEPPATPAATQAPPPSTEAPTIPTTEDTTAPPTEESTQPATEETTGQVQDYIINKNSGKFHTPDCESAAKMKEENKEYFTGTREELIEQGYDPCGNCKP